MMLTYFLYTIIAIELARYKIPVILNARDQTRLKELATMIEECYGVPTKVIISDFTNKDAASEVMKMISDEMNLDVDILINNAGIGDTRELVEMDLQKIQDIINVNVLTVSKLCQMLGEKMKQRRRGRIVIISSITGIAPGVPTSATYAATKAYLNSFAVSIGMELEPYGIGVSCIMPGM